VFAAFSRDATARAAYTRQASEDWRNFFSSRASESRLGGRLVFSWSNVAFQRAGIIVPAVNKKGETKLTVRNLHQTRLAMADVLAAKFGIRDEPVQAAA
jgi:hypothetical protein